mgnify:CR=1 FL=1
MRAPQTLVLVALVVLAACAVAPAQQRSRPTPVKPTPAQLTETYLNGVARVLHELPTDDRFGADRTEHLLHGRSVRHGEDKTAGDAYRALRAQNFEVEVMTFGVFDRAGVPERYKVASWVRTLIGYEIKSPLQQIAMEVRRTRKPVQERTVNHEKVKVMVSARPIFARRECLSCHPGVKSGEVVGVAMVARHPEPSGR